MGTVLDEFFNVENWVKAVIAALTWLESQVTEVCFILVATLLAKFLPVVWLNRMGLDPQNHIYHVTVVRLMWACVVYLFVFGGARLTRGVGTLFYLHNLGEDEKQFLHGFIDKNSRNFVYRRVSCWF